MAEEVKQETMADYAKELEASLRTIREGDIVSGTVIAVNEDGAVLDLEYYASGIIKAEDMSNDPKFELLKEIQIGDTIEATVVRQDDGKGNIRLSRKEAADVLSWDVLQAYLETQKVLTVTISEIVKAGAITYVEGIRGFIPASQLSLQYVEDLEPWNGRQLEVRVITVDGEAQKLVLSAKAIEQERAHDALQKKVAMMVPGSIVEGTVESLMPYGAFVALEDGISGLVHISQICQKRIKKPSEVLTTGDKVKVKILKTDSGKVSLSIKAVEEESADAEGGEAFEYASGEEAVTTLGDLFRNLKL